MDHLVARKTLETLESTASSAHLTELLLELKRCGVDYAHVRAR